MRFPYHQIEDDTIETVGNIQSNSGGPDGDVNMDDDGLFCPSSPLLPYWPLVSGWCQIFTGLLCVGFGAAEVFVLSYSISSDVGWQLNWFNSYGTPLFSGILLVITGSLAARVYWDRNINSIGMFYIVALLSFILNLGMMIWILICKIRSPLTLVTQCNGSYQDTLLKMICENQEKVETYSTVIVLSAVWCLLGCLLLFLTTVNYFVPVMFGNVQLLKAIGVCCIPCIFYKPSKEVLDPYSQEKNVKN